MRVIRDIEQGTKEWLDVRSGKITGTGFSKVMAKGQGKTRTSYMHQLAAEIITAEIEDSYTNKYMEHGTETEPQARAMYELMSGNSIEEIAFVGMDNGFIGVSPDSFSGDDGLLEIKCPKTTTQIERFLSPKLPSTYKAQVQGQMWVCEKEWCDFVSFDPRINGEAGYICVRVERDEEYIKNLSDECIKFNDELRNLVNILND